MWERSVLVERVHMWECASGEGAYVGEECVSGEGAYVGEEC